MRSLVPQAALTLGATAAALLLAGCGAPAEGDPATWALTDSSQISAESTTLEIEVTRLSCSGGNTGEVLEPVVTYEEQRIVIAVDVAPLPEGAYTCPGNDAVPVTVELEEAVGPRDLVDGACLEGDAATTAECGDPVRRPAG